MNTTLGAAMVLGSFLIAVGFTALGMWLLCGEVVRRQARTIRQLRRKAAELATTLSEAEQATPAPTGTHHRQETPTDA